MSQENLYTQLAKRTDGSVYIGVVGPVRSGKSTFIKRTMEEFVLPAIDNEEVSARARDELPQSSAGNMIMTTEPKFVPEEAIQIDIDDTNSFKMRMIDCVGYVVNGSEGYMTGNNPRLVESPWSKEPMPFEQAAKIGTDKVIREHSTIGIVITTDGSFTDIPREDYAQAETGVINQLKQIEKPFMILLNTVDPQGEQSKKLCQYLQHRHQVPVMAVNCQQIGRREIEQIFSTLLYQFPVKQIMISMPRWLNTLAKDHWLHSSVYQKIAAQFFDMECIGQIKERCEGLKDCEYISGADIVFTDLGNGNAKINIGIDQNLFYQILSENTGIEIKGESDLMPTMIALCNCKKKYDKVKNALDEVEATGYGIVMPDSDELVLEEPQIIRQGSRYGVKLRASAPSIHMMKANIKTEVSPIVGSEQQSEELVLYLLKEFEENPSQLWQSNIFGKSLHELVNEGLHNKLYRMPQDARGKIQETLERIINEGCSGLICIII